MKIEAPLGVIEKIGERIFLKKYMTAFLIKKNKELKELIEK
jgi:hypothetical protein